MLNRLVGQRVQGCTALLQCHIRSRPFQPPVQPTCGQSACRLPEEEQMLSVRCGSYQGAVLEVMKTM